jgi:alpha-galactosidase
MRFPRSSILLLFGLAALPLRAADAAAAPSSIQGPGGSADLLQLLADSGLAVADAAVVDKSGHLLASDKGGATKTGNGLLPRHGLPASFVYGGQPSASLLGIWPREQKAPLEQGDRTIYETTWREPGGGLTATWHVELFHQWSAMEFRWIFTNEGKVAAKPLTNVEALDLDTPLPNRTVRLIHSTGGLTGDMHDADLGFAVTESSLGESFSASSQGEITLSAAGGLSSNKDLPFFVVHAEQPDEGLFFGIGWSGQWQAHLSYTNRKELRITTEMPGMNLALPPGERIISPSILLGTYTGPWTTGSNLLRRLLYAEYTPLLGGVKPLPPVIWNSWFILGNGISEKVLKPQIDGAAAAGVEYFCIGAGWTPGGFPMGTGNWRADPQRFPQGLGPIGDYVNKKGMKLGLWFEPERAMKGSWLALEHPEWVHGDLLDFGNKDARDWVFNMMKGLIDTAHLNWIVFDFNTSPLDAWNRADAPSQRGLTQIRHIMGLYQFLDRLLKAYPDLRIQGCASGGRRMDLETLRRSHTFWKSDETRNLPVLRFHETGGNVFLPGGILNTNVLPQKIDYDMESVFGGPLGLRCDWTKVSPSDLQAIRAQITLYKQVRSLLNDEYYPLFPQHRDESGWIGWQFNSPARGEGYLVVLRPKDSPYPSAQISLRGLDPGAIYRLSSADGAGKPLMETGKEFNEGFPLDLPPETSSVFRYGKVK